MVLILTVDFILHSLSFASTILVYIIICSINMFLKIIKYIPTTNRLHAAIDVLYTAI